MIKVTMNYSLMLLLVAILMCSVLCEHDKHTNKKKKHHSHHVSKSKHHWKHSHVLKKDKRGSNTIEIDLQNGRIRGSINQTATNQTKYYRFQGIPYAKPPVGDLRFEPPESYQWEGTYDATYQRNICIQNTFPNSLDIRGSEDCLYLNIYTPTTSLSSPSAVMVWIHGGGFLNGDGNYENYPTDRFIDEELVVVTMNYRLGVFGFLTTGDGVVPGNMGLKDQTLALKWIKQNIESFGGDPGQITIMGQSAGGGSVAYLVQSPATKGLFARAAAHSGNSLGPWSLSRAGVNNTKTLGRLFTSSTNFTVIVEELKKVDANKLSLLSAITMSIFLLADLLDGLVYAPVIEPPNPTELFSSKTYEQISSCNLTAVPLIIGYNSEEAEGVEEMLGLFKFYFARYDLSPSGLVPVDMNVNTTQEKNTLGAEIKQTYVGQLGLVFESNGTDKYISDDFFVRPTNKYVNLYSKCGQNIYQYRFSYTRNSTRGVGHAEEVPYFFNNGSLGSKQDEVLSVNVVKLWSNFIKTGNPTPDNTLNVIWYPSTDANNHSYLDVGNQFVNYNAGTNPDKSFLDKWEQWYDTYGNRPYDTY